MDWTPIMQLLTPVMDAGGQYRRKNMLKRKSIVMLLVLLCALVYSRSIVSAQGTANLSSSLFDLNGDGYGDLLFQHLYTGETVGYLMSGLTVADQADIYNGGDPNWKVVATGDLDGDSTTDIIFQNQATGETVGYLMSGLTVVQQA